jgi:hypothetical protein
MQMGEVEVDADKDEQLRQSQVHEIAFHGTED